MTAPAIWMLIGLPVDKEQLIRRLSTDAEVAANDFCLQFAPPPWRNGTCEDVAAWVEARFANSYQPKVGAALARLAAAALAAGVTVVEEAGLTELAAAAGAAQIIIVVSHWKAHEFSGDDFLPNFASEAPARLASATSPVADWLRRESAPRPWYHAPFRSPRSLSFALHRLAEANFDDQPKTAGVARFFELPVTRGARRRIAVDALFDGLVRPGNRLELFDGLHTREAFAEVLASFCGLLDLTTCTSTWLGDYVTRVSNDRIRTVQFPTEQEFNDAGCKLTATFELVAQGWTYLDARKAVQGVFDDVARDMIEEERR